MDLRRIPTVLNGRVLTAGIARIAGEARIKQAEQAEQAKHVLQMIRLTTMFKHVCVFKRSSNFFLMGLFGVTSALHAQTPASTRALDQIAVVVNQQAITLLDLQRREQFLVAQLKRNNQAVPDAQILSNAVLERAVLETLMLQQATAQGLTPSDALVQQTIADNAQQSGLEPAAFIRRIEQSGVSAAEYASDLKNELAITQVRERALAAKSKVSEAEVDRFLKEPESGIKHEFLAQVLFLAKSEALGQAGETENAQRYARAVALQVQAQSTASGAAFSGLQNALHSSTQHLEIPSISKKHVVDLPYSSLEQMPELYSAAIENMAVGQTSAVLDSSAGYFIIRLAAKRSIPPQIQQTKARHILLRVPSPSDEASITAQIKRLHDRLTLNIDLFPSLAKQWSQDGSAETGGDLGWAMPGDMVPEFERVMDVLKVGEMALPVRSPFGWHIVQVLERKVSDMPQDRLRARAKNVIRARKQDDALGEWLEQLKSQAYIEYKR